LRPYGIAAVSRRWRGGMQAGRFSADRTTFLAVDLTDEKIELARKAFAAGVQAMETRVKAGRSRRNSV
jgi:hypothetical protein